MTARNTIGRWALGTALTATFAAAAVAGAPAASAATHHAVPRLTVHQEDAAVAAATSSDARELLATATRGAAGRHHTAVPRTAPRVSTEGAPVYALSAAFVRGDSSNVGQLWYVATTATTGAGAMTIFTAPDSSGHWHAVNVASGNTEARMAAAAHGAALLVEPAVNAWYAVSGTTIRPLNAAARDVVGKAPVTVAAYQRIVHSRYADKQANSRYAKEGMAGGFAATAGGATSSNGVDGGQLGLAAGGVLAAGAVGLRLKRRRHT